MNIFHILDKVTSHFSLLKVTHKKVTCKKIFLHGVAQLTITYSFCD